MKKREKAKKKMSKSHNKKRNAAFLYEILTNELTKSIISKDDNKKHTIISLIKEHFKRGSYLSKELECYKQIINTKSVDRNIAEKILNEVKRTYFSFGQQQELSNEQNKLIKKINKSFPFNIYSNFVPNYKHLASLYQIFNSMKLKLNAKSKVMLEESIINHMVSKDDENQKNDKMEPMTRLVFKTYVQKFNDKYGILLKEQKELLEKYILSSLDDIEFKIYLNEEIGRLKDVINSSLSIDEVKNDEEMKNKTLNVLNILENYKKVPCDNMMIEQLLKVQQLAEEVIR